jgi:hypothetical protein
MSTPRSYTTLFKEFILEFNKVQDKRKSSRLDAKTFYVSDKELDEAKDIEDKYTKQIEKLRENSLDLMTKALQETSDSGRFETQATELLMRGSAIAVKMLSNPINEDLLEVFKKRFPIDPNDDRYVKERDKEENRHIVYDPSLTRAVVRYTDDKKQHSKLNNIFSQKQSFTAIGIPTANVNLFKKDHNPFALIIDPTETYLRSSFCFPFNENTDTRWWIANTMGFDLQGGIDYRLQLKIKTTNIDGLRQSQQEDMKKGLTSNQNEIMPKVPLKAFLGILLPEEKDQKKILHNHLSGIYANYLWRYYCYSKYPELVDLWQHFPIYLHKPILGKTDIFTAYEAKNIGIIPYTIEDQIKDLEAARQMDDEVLNTWIAKIEALTTAHGPKLYPSEIIDTLEDMRPEKIHSKACGR